MVLADSCCRSLGGVRRRAEMHMSLQAQARGQVQLRTRNRMTSHLLLAPLPSEAMSLRVPSGCASQRCCWRPCAARATTICTPASHDGDSSTSPALMLDARVTTFPAAAAPTAAPPAVDAAGGVAAAVASAAALLNASAAAEARGRRPAAGAPLPSLEVHFALSEFSAPHPWMTPGWGTGARLIFSPVSHLGQLVQEASH